MKIYSNHHKFTALGVANPAFQKQLKFCLWSNSNGKDKLGEYPQEAVETDTKM